MNNATELLLLIADGVRAGTLVPSFGTAEIADVGYTMLDSVTLQEVSKAPDTFTFRCDLVISKTALVDKQTHPA